jgi:hypothetical protein
MCIYSWYSGNYFSSSNYMASNDTMINELEGIWKEWLWPNLSWCPSICLEEQENHGSPQLGQPVFGKEFVTWIVRIRFRDINRSATTFSETLLPFKSLINVNTPKSISNITPESKFKSISSGLLRRTDFRFYTDVTEKHAASIFQGTK